MIVGAFMAAVSAFLALAAIVLARGRPVEDLLPLALVVALAAAVGVAGAWIRRTRRDRREGTAPGERYPRPSVASYLVTFVSGPLLAGAVYYMLYPHETAGVIAALVVLGTGYLAFLLRG